jgi:rhamnosyltransferase
MRTERVPAGTVDGSVGGRPTAGNVVAVVVTLEPHVDVVSHVRSLVGRVARIVVVDNGSGPEAAPALDEIARQRSVQLVRNPDNEGIARALNQGALVAEQVGADWLLTLDQDAAPSPEIVGIAGAIYDAYPRPELVAVIGSASDTDPAPKRGATSLDRPWAEAKVAITAGSFVSLAAYRALGGFRDELFVDYVDIEFCLRARARGYRVLKSLVPGMAHRIGQPTLRRIGLRAVTPTNHSVLRRYYISRNRFLVWRGYWRRDPGFVAGDVVASQKELVKLLLFEDDRRRKLRAMLLGFRDGLGGRTGRSPASRHGR